MRSMTGYGQAALESDGRECSVEIKSVNHRFLDINIRAPRVLAFVEDGLRKMISARVSRGHLDVYVSYRNDREDARSVVVDEALLAAYFRAFERIASTRDVGDAKPAPIDIAHLPELVRIEAADEDKPLVTELCVAALKGAIDAMISMRCAEGDALCRDILDRLDTLEKQRAMIVERAPLVVEEYRVKLEQRIREAIDTLPDPMRVAAEIALLADRSAIDEELTRLSSHIAQMRQLAGSDQPVGRKLDFLVQEMVREVNTIGSKSSDINISKLVVDAKGEIEKLREQIQNVE